MSSRHNDVPSDASEEQQWKSPDEFRSVRPPSLSSSTASADDDKSEDDIITVETMKTLRRMESAYSVRNGLDERVATLSKSASSHRVAPAETTGHKATNNANTISSSSSSSDDAERTDKKQKLQPPTGGAAAADDGVASKKSGGDSVAVDMPPKPASLTAQRSSSRMQLSRKERGFILTGLALALLMAALDNTIVGTALPKITEDLGGTADEYSWVVIAYLLASTALAPTYGRFADLWGRRNVYFGCMILFLVGSALCGAAQNITWLIIARGVQGLGGGGLIGLAFVVIGDIASPRDRGKYAGILGGMFALASVFGPLAGGVLTDHASWRWCFYINLPIGIVAFIMLALAFKRNKHGNSQLRLDFTGTFIMITIVILVELGISWGGSRYAWDDPLIIILLVIGLWLIVPFVFSQRDAPAPIIPMRLFRFRNFTIASIAGFLLGIPMFASFIFLPVWFQSVRFYTATDSGIEMLALMLSLITASIIAGGLMTKTGHYRPFLWIGAILLPIGYGCVSLLDENSGQETFIPVQLAIGFGIGLCLNVMTTMAQNVVPPEDLAVATTVVTFFRTVGASLGIAIFTAVLADMSEEAADVLKEDIAMLAPMPGAKLLIQSKIAGYAIPRTFLYTTPIAVLPFLVFLFTQHIPLKSDEDENGGHVGGFAE
jgi:EmrB/QacA subfamily drug resistance transporter